MSKCVCCRVKRLNRFGLSLGLAVAAAGLLAAGLTLPLWHLRMEAPQYRDEEALKVAVYPHALRGDLNEIKVLNQYIGVHIPSHLPQLDWLPAVLLAGGALGLLALFLPARIRRAGLVTVPVLLSLALAGAALQAQWQMYDIGHKRDHKTKLVGVKDFNTPLLGRARIAQFDVTAGLGTGAYVIGVAILLQLAGAWLAGTQAPRGVDGCQAEASAHDDWTPARQLHEAQ